MRRRVLAAVGIGVLALSGCSVGADSMQAAASDEFTISQAQVETQVGEVLTGLEHPRQIVQRRLDVGATTRLDEGADHVVVLVAVLVVPHGGPVDRSLERRRRDEVAPLMRGTLGRLLQIGEDATGVPA